MPDSFDEMLERSKLASRSANLKQAVLRCYPRLQPSGHETDLNMEIHPGDQMFTHSLREHQDVDAALSQYFNIALQQYSCAQQILDGAFTGHADDISLLDFACGFGRLLRFITLTMPKRQLSASELQTEALDFVNQAFGVRTLQSHADPADFEFNEKFDFIWVASLFTHLPEVLFVAWLEKLYSMLSPRGVLCFSVRDIALLTSDEHLPAAGILYIERSENLGLSTEIYGTTYANEKFVGQTIREIAGVEHTYVRLKRALANEQDLYIFPKDCGHDFRGLDHFQRGAWGWVDRRALSEPGELYLEGWAGSQDEGAARSVEIIVDGMLHTVSTGIARPDVRDAFNSDLLANAGWALRTSVAREVGSVDIQVIARTANGSSALLFAGTLIRGSSR